MSIFPLLVVCFLFGALPINVQPNHVPVFVSGTEGYRSFRIPALITGPNGELLAFCEGRGRGVGDFGNIDIVMKRSVDGGKTWSPLQVVAEFGDLQVCNPAPVGRVESAPLWALSGACDGACVNTSLLFAGTGIEPTEDKPSRQG